MKKMRKGFTLVELLIVVAILAILSAVMTASITGQTAKAKASAILNNVAAFKKAAEYYYADHWDSKETMDDSTSGKVVHAYVPTFSETDGLTDGPTATAITYKPDNADASGKGLDDNGIPKWSVTVDFSNDGESEAIKTALQSHAGYSSVGTSFKVTLYTGEIGTAAAASGGGSGSGNNGG